MRQVREIVRLHQAGVSTLEIGIRVGVAASTVRPTLRRVEAAGMVDGIAAANRCHAGEAPVLRRRQKDWPSSLCRSRLAGDPS